MIVTHVGKEAPTGSGGLTKDLLWDFFLHFCFNSFNDMIMLSSQD